MQSKTQIITSYASQLNLGGIRELLEDIILSARQVKKKSVMLTLP